MYGKEEIKELKSNFWSGFEKRMKKHRSANNNSKVNWNHYRTSINHLYFRLEVDEQHVVICIDIQHKDDGIRKLFYEQFTELKGVMTPFFTQELEWYPDFDHSNGRTVSRIACMKQNCNYLNENQHDDILTFLEKNLIGLDAFWCEYNEILFQLK